MTKTRSLWHAIDRRVRADARRLRSEEGGWAMVTALVLLLIMLPVGLAVAANGDTRAKLSGTERARESAFNLAEGVLSTEIYMLSHNWPGFSNKSYSAAGCSSGAANLPAECPDNTRLMAGFTGADYNRGLSWTTTVSDNNGQSASFYSDALAAAQPKWDSNNDKSMWVRASATVRGVTRVVVAQIKVEMVDTSLGFPRNAVTAGNASNSGQSNAGALFVDTKGTAAQTAAFVVRCNTSQPGCPGGSGLQSNVSPATITGSYAGGSAMSAAVLDGYRQRAKSEGTYYGPTGCPSQSNVPKGPVVFIESGDCQINSNAFTSWNTALNPGLLIVARGTLHLLGTLNKVFYGVVYAANLQNSSGTVVHLQDRSVQGAVAVDGSGNLLVESQNSMVALTYDPNAFGQLNSFGTAGVVQNTFRELTPR